MSITIYSVVPKRLIEDAKRIEKHAEDQLEAWIALGQSDKYAKALDQARILRLAANGKDVYSRRAFLKIAGFTVKNLDKTPKENPTMKPASPAQLAARKRFAEMARSGAFKKATKRKANPEPTHDFAKIGKPFAFDGRTWKVSQYAHTGKTIEAFTTDRKSPYRRETFDVAMLMSPRRKINPLPPVVETILEQMGGNKFMVMTGARPVVHGPHMLTFKLPTNQSKANYLDVIHNPGKDLYTMTFRRVSNRGMDSKNLVEYDDVYADQLQPMFEKVTGMYTTLGTMGRKSNPTKKTVSQKVSQLVHEGYPQRQAVAVALSEQRAGKVKRNPMMKEAISRLPSNFKYGVQTKATENWGLQAAFKTKIEAQDYAKAIEKNYPRLPIRVITFTGGSIK